MTGSTRHIAHCLRCDFLPECHGFNRNRDPAPNALELVLKQWADENRVSGFYGIRGELYKQRLDKWGYFTEMLSDTTR